MKQSLKRTLILSLVFALVLAPSVANAWEGTVSGEPETTPSESTSPSPTPTPQRVEQLKNRLEEQLNEMEQERQTKIATVKADLQAKLDTAKKRACDNHQATINKLMTTMDQRRQNAFDRITKITTAVENYYTQKQLSISNYTDLVAAVDAAKDAAQTAMAAQQAIPPLNCSGDHPRADVADFKDKRAGSIDAIKAYRDAAKALVDAVKAAAKTTQGGTTNAN